ncbi:hypothetical protein ACFFUB_14800 [Algimonas porphyrae]|nr:hypothetical protein [Algimonas porphyrae]
MRAILLIVALGVSACASNPDAGSMAADMSATGSASADRLPPQTLAAGECGLFGWDAVAATRFVFFAKGGAALYADGQSIRSMRSEGAFPATDYGPVQIELGPPDALIDGVRYPEARLTALMDDGYTRVQPLVMLESCRGN